MRKIFLAAWMMLALLLTGCGGEEEKNPPPEPEGSGNAKIGIIAHLNASEQEFNEIMQHLENSYRPSEARLSADYKYFDNINDLQLALNSGQIDMFINYQCVANYISQRNADIEILNSERTLVDTFCFATRRGDTILLNELNKAIKIIENDGTLADLCKTYILEVKGDVEPPAVELPKFDGADTIKVAVTGDLPPLDLVRADGSPAGFSTAVLAEVAKHMHKNIELINVDSGARAVALTSKQVDVVFWVSVPKNSHLIPANIDKPAGVSLTQPYYQDSVVHITLEEK